MASDFQSQLRKTAATFNKMIRVEAAEYVGIVSYVRFNMLLSALSRTGEVTCVTCGETRSWTEMDAGHFLGSSWQTIRFEETGCHPQCRICNSQSGMPDQYKRYMLHRYGQEEIDRLERVKHMISGLNRIDLEEMHAAFTERISTAIKTMKER